MEDKQEHKSHHQRHSGKKALNKKLNSKNDQDENVSAKQRNPKAFAYNSADKAEKNFRRTMDIKSRKHHIPLVDRTPLEPPPIVVAIVGPPKVGKSTLLHCLIKNFTRQTISSINGPVTIVSGKQRRLTFIECTNDINNMIDVAKVADLVLLLVDASFGFEMETFEFLNICQVHGFPRIMGVLTHLDAFKNNKALRKTKKQLKKRFWTEIYQGAKLFYLSGMVHKEYQKTEIHNLGRFISVMKFRPLTWKLSHPYILSDRMEDLTDVEKIRKNPKCDRTISLYGYTRGGCFKNKSHVHIPGCGDFEIHDMSFLPDPCPLPDKEKRRSLNEKEKLIYAPMSGVGGIIYDKDAVYIDLGGSHSHKSKEDDGEIGSNDYFSSLIASQAAIDEKMASSEMKIFNDSVPLSNNMKSINMPEETAVYDEKSGLVRRKAMFEDDESTDGNDDDEDDYGSSSDESEGDENEEIPRQNNSSEVINVDEEVAFADSDDDLENYSNKENSDVKTSDDTYQELSAEASTLRWKDNLKERAINSFYNRQSSTKNLRKLVYSNEKQDLQNEENENEEVGGLFHVTKSKDSLYEEINQLDCSRYANDEVQDWSSSEILGQIKDCFVTGKWKKNEDAETMLQQDDELYGDFEDLETGEVEEGKMDGSDIEKEMESSDDVDGDDKEAEVEKKKTKREMTLKEKRLDKKRKLKELFDTEYDDKEGGSYYDDLKSELNQQSQLNKNEFENMDDDLRVQYEGFRPGMYVRVEINSVPCELVTNFDPSYPIILGGLLSGEENIGYVTVRLKKHRWYPKILKTRDPLIISLGWRRFQTIPLYTMQDHNGRNRLLKYTPQHLHCNAHFWGPITPQNTGFLAVQSVNEKDQNKSNFRVSATGAVIDLDKSTEIVKKLKLTGTPLKVFKKTAFLKGMFSTALEVTKFEGANIRTVSGIRGQIKKAIKAPPGAFRATFEDKILLSDIVFVRTWFTVQVPQLYNPVTTLLLPADQKAQWNGMKTVGQLRRERNLKAPSHPDSHYKEIVREKKVFKPLVIPRELQKQLPYAAKPKHAPKTLVPTAESKRVAVVREPQEQKVAKLMKTLRAMHSSKVRKERMLMKARSNQHHKEMKKLGIHRNSKIKERKKQAFRNMGKRENRNSKKQE